GPASRRGPRFSFRAREDAQRGIMPGELKIFCGRSHPALGQEICEYFTVPAGKVSAFNFSDGETFCQIEENVRGSDVFVVQPTCNPVNDNLMELLILLGRFKRSSASG